MIHSADQKTKIVHRPLLKTLGEIAKKSASGADAETYEAFFNRMQGLCDGIINDPNDLELDAFAKHLGFRPPEYH